MDENYPAGSKIQQPLPQSYQINESHKIKQTL